MKRLLRLNVLSLLLLTACGKSLPELKGFDRDLWKNDANGCNKQRLGLTDAVLSGKDQLLGLSEMEIVSVLGNPDQHELYTRNQKFYRYYLEPNEKCNPASLHPKKLVVRFNAVGLAKEITLE